LLGLALWKGPTDWWPLLLLAWLGLSVAGDIIRGTLSTTPVELVRRAASVTLTFHYVCLAWVFFRATDFANARDVLWQLSEFSTDAINASPGFRFVLAVAAVSHLIPPGSFRWLKEAFVSLPPLARALVMAISALLLSELTSTDVVPFIYFQF
jgi:alginate O-acetyltransferase complex protein AlgI